jgi:predicted DNA-binding transcriptional regulator AlpA
MTGYEVVNFRGLKAIGIPYSRTHVRRMEKNGGFPRAFKLGDHRNSPFVWWLHEIIEWLKAKAARRRGS